MRGMRDMVATVLRLQVAVGIRHRALQAQLYITPTTSTIYHPSPLPSTTLVGILLQAMLQHPIPTLLLLLPLLL